MSLNFPYFMYPGYPLYGYMDIAKYNEEIKKVLELFKLLNLSYSSECTNLSNNKTLLHLTIGACMEEYLNMCNQAEKKLYSFQWEQLFPYHLRTYAKNGGKVINIIISPTNSFDKNSWVDPSFIKFTAEFDWEINENCIRSTKFDVTIYLYYSMMPSFDEFNYSKCSLLINNFEMYVPMVIQSTNDIVFIREFYDELKILINNVKNKGGLFTCYSFAVFEINTKKSKFNNFTMFSEIKSLFENDDNSNQLLAEWVYLNTSNTLIEYNKHTNTNNKLITYTDSFEDEIARIAISDNNNKISIVREFDNRII